MNRILATNQPEKRYRVMPTLYLRHLPHDESNNGCAVPRLQPSLVSPFLEPADWHDPNTLHHCMVGPIVTAASYSSPSQYLTHQATMVSPTP